MPCASRPCAPDLCICEHALRPADLGPAPCALRPGFEALRPAPCAPDLPAGVPGPARRTKKARGSMIPGQASAPRAVKGAAWRLVFDNGNRLATGGPFAKLARGALDAAPGFF